MLASIAALFAANAHGQDAGVELADIRSFDFRNFVYSDLGHTRIRVRDGHWEPRRRIDGECVSLDVVDVIYGDLTGDGRDEAFVWLDECGGGTGRWSFGYVYTPTPGAPRRVGVLSGRDRADGGIGRVRVEGGRLLVDSFGHDTGGSTDVEWVETEAWVIRNDALRFDAATNRRAYFGTSWGAYHAATWGMRSLPVRFLPRGARAVLDGFVSAEYPERWTLRPRSGRAFEIDLTHVRAEGLRVEVRAHDGTSLATITAGQRERVILPDQRESSLLVTSRDPAEYWAEVAWLDAP